MIPLVEAPEIDSKAATAGPNTEPFRNVCAQLSQKQSHTMATLIFNSGSLPLYYKG